MPLRDSTLIVSGAGSGIGLATAVMAAEAGAGVVLLDRDRAALDRAAQGADGRLFPVVCDVTDADQVDAAVRTVVERFGPPDGLVASAGIERGGPTHRVPPGDWRATLDVNLTGSFLLCQAVIRALVDDADATGSAHPASIVCLSSPAAFVGFSAGENAAYSASKGGVSALVRTLAIEYAAAGIRVNAVVPGATETPLMWANVPGADIEAVRSQTADAVPLGRLAEPREIAEVIVWLLGDGARYVTGTHVVCDGGLLAKAAIAV